MTGSRPHRLTDAPSSIARAEEEVPDDIAREQVIRPEEAEHLNDPRHESGPPGLVARAEPGAVVTVEVLVEKEEILPVGIGLEPVRPSVHRATTLFVGNEDRHQPPSDLLGHVEEGAKAARAGG